MNTLTFCPAFGAGVVFPKLELILLPPAFPADIGGKADFGPVDTERMKQTDTRAKTVHDFYDMCVQSASRTCLSVKKKTAMVVHF